MVQTTVQQIVENCHKAVQEVFTFEHSGHLSMVDDNTNFIQAHQTFFTKHDKKTVIKVSKKKYFILYGSMIAFSIGKLNQNFVTIKFFFFYGQF